MQPAAPSEPQPTVADLMQEITNLKAAIKTTNGPLAAAVDAIDAQTLLKQNVVG
jgi:hypothetical protein